MSTSGQSFEQFNRHMISIPQDFMAEPRIGKFGNICISAVLNDLLLNLDLDTLSQNEIHNFESNDLTKRNYLCLVLISVWMLAEESINLFIKKTDNKEKRQKIRAKILNFLIKDLNQISRLVSANKFISETDRREELIRSFLAILGIIPAGENELTAQDRLNSVSSIERARVISETKEAKARAVEVLRALKKKAADESADKWGRE